MGEKNNWGGRRDGSGRPSTGKKNLVAFRADADVVEKLQGKTNKSEYINECIRKNQE